MERDPAPHLRRARVRRFKALVDTKTASFDRALDHIHTVDRVEP